MIANRLPRIDSGGFRPANRISSIGVSEILQIGAMAHKFRGEGRPVILLGAGEPDFDTPEHIKAAAERAMRMGATKYTALDGTAELKAAVASKFRRENGLDFRADEITVAAGAKQVIYNALVATLNEGDEVVLAAPYWTTYADIVRIAGGRPIIAAGREDDDFRLQPGDLEKAISERTRWLLLNSPSNPSGAIYSAEQMSPLLDVLKRQPKVWLLTDDVYEHLVYDDRPFVTAAQIAPDLRERTLTVNGVSKAYAMTGWRIGYGAGPAELIAAMAIVQSQSTSNPSSISQAAAVEALTGPQGVLAVRRYVFQCRRDLVVERLNRVDGIECRRPQGAFYTFASCAGLIGRKTPAGQTIDDDIGFCTYLLEQHDVAVVPGSCFGLGPYFRISYAASEQNLEEACRRIARGCEALS
jgi:aspartate aminotransferase